MISASLHRWYHAATRKLKMSPSGAEGSFQATRNHVLIIAPVWPAQHWYTLILQMLAGYPLLLSSHMWTSSILIDKVILRFKVVLGWCQEFPVKLQTFRRSLDYNALWRESTPKLYDCMWNLSINPISAPIYLLLDGPVSCWKILQHS